jgi:hypothetical protein
VAVTPLSLTDKKAQGVGGCVAVHSESGIDYDLVWDGKSHIVVDHWLIQKTPTGGKATRKATALSADSFDKALRILFGLDLET